MARSVKLWLVHGFLGLPQDWQFLNLPGVACRPVDLWSDFSKFGPSNLNQWAQSWLRYNKELREFGGDQFLLGYSLGGRWALHVIQERPELFKGAVFVSTHPGFSDPGECRSRLLHDRSWAGKFAREPWADLMSEWHQQPVLRTSSRWERQESRFDRGVLSRAILASSLGVQQDFRPFIAQAQLRQLWLVGEKDKKFRALAQTLPPRAEVQVVSGAGHRVPWDEPAQFAQHISRFVLSTESSNTERSSQ